LAALGRPALKACKARPVRLAIPVPRGLLARQAWRDNPASRVPLAQLELRSQGQQAQPVRACRPWPRHSFLDR